jgi:hypothetical protein
MATTLELPLTHHGRLARMYVASATDGGWKVRAEIDGTEVLHTHCSTWQRVERLRARLQRELDTTPPSPWVGFRSSAAALLLLMTLLTAPFVAAQTRDSLNAVFHHRLDDYLALRQEVRSEVAPEHIIDPRIREVSGALLAVRLQKARAGAAPNDIFPAALTDIIRDRLHEAFEATEVDVLLMNLYPDGVPMLTTCVNAHYDRTVAVAPPASVLSALPPLPGALGYRLIGRDIALWDEEAHIVVDVVTGALPEPRVWKFLDVSSTELRRLIHTALQDAHIDAHALMEDLARDHAADARRPVVGEPFDWRVGHWMPPSVLHALPPLPAPLEYRFVGSDLVVIDVHSGEVRGLLWNVLPPPPGRHTVAQ